LCVCLTEGVPSREGWAPICAFLNLEQGTGCPTTPYPRLNEGAELKALISLFEFVTAWWTWIAVGLYAAVVTPNPRNVQWFRSGLVFEPLVSLSLRLKDLLGPVPSESKEEEDKSSSL